MNTPRWRDAVVPAVVGVAAAAATFAVAEAVTGGEPARTPGAPPPAAAAPLPTAFADGRDAFARMGCGNCHHLEAADANGQIGPDLDASLAHHDRASLVAKIVDPYADGAPGFAVMPEDYGRVMSAAELDALVDFLLAARGQ
jgi:hypothetical protein